MTPGPTLRGRVAGAGPLGTAHWAALPIRFDRHELAGGLADLGVMIPLAVGVAAVAHLSLTVVFICVAASYAATALVFRVPVPVQPMKAMAAAIIALGLSPAVVGAAGIEIGIVLLLLAITPLARVLARLFPMPVVRGIQLAIGLLLLKSAVAMAGKSDAIPGAHVAFSLGGTAITAGLVVALIIAVALLLGRERGRVPAGLIVLGLGAIAGIALALAGVSHLTPVSAGSSVPLVRLPSLHDAWIALFALVVPQLPLSLGNAVFASEDVLGHYFGGGARRATATNLCLSMGLINLGCGLVGGMPLCHGSGGATAHYRLGARTAGATLAAAAVYALLATAAGFGLSPLFIPGAVLAGMLLFVGVEHILLVTDLVAVDGVLTAVLIAGVALAVNNLAIGYAGGWIAYLVLKQTPLHRLRLQWPALTGRLAPRPVLAERFAPQPVRAEVEAR